jgi:glycosyltransferase involved in cell wall biosynthesis
MSILEGMACGLPVISSAATGVARLINNGENGYIFNQAREMAALLENLKSPDLRQALGEQARNTAESHTWEKTASVYEKICHEMAALKKEGSSPI